MLAGWAFVRIASLGTRCQQGRSTRRSRTPTPVLFVILPAHLIADVEDVVLQSDGFLIVAKREGTPKHIAVRTDPRR